MNSRLQLAAVASSLVLLQTGCKAHDMGVSFADKQARHVDSSWLMAANHCWPELRHQGFTVADVQRYLADPPHFRATFGTYAGLDDAALLQLVATPVMTAAAPDSGVLNNAPHPVLTRSEALTGSNPAGTELSMNHGIAPNDALCAIQPGLPVGFK